MLIYKIKKLNYILYNDYIYLIIIFLYGKLIIQLYLGNQGKTKITLKIIDFIDHFSKFYWGFLIENRTAETSLKYIKKYFALNKKPKLLQSDNGKEFDNLLIKEYLENNNVKHIRSRPHHPQTNGCLERYHRELHKYMYNILKDSEIINDNKVEEALDSYIEYHNSTKKTSTQYSPNEIRDLTDIDMINKIKLNIIKKTKIHNISGDELIDEGEKLLLWNNIKLDKNKYVFKSKTIGNYAYPCIFSSYINNNTIKIVPYIDVDDIIKKGEAINVHYSTCVIIPEYCFDYFVKKFEKKTIDSKEDDNLEFLLGTDKESEDYIYYSDNKLNNEIDNNNINISNLDKKMDNNSNEIKDEKNGKKGKTKKKSKRY